MLRTPLFRRIALRLAGVATMVAALAVLTLGTPQTADAALSPLGWAVSNTTVGLTGTTHAFTFNKTGGNVTARCLGVTTTAPGGFAGTPSGAVAYGVAPLTSTTISGGTLFFLFSANSQIRTGSTYYFETGGITNTSTPGSYTVTATLYSNTGCSTVVTGETGTSAAVNFASLGIATTIQVARSTVVSITSNTAGIGLDPGVNDGAGTREIVLGITSNAGSGYVINCAISAQPSGFSARTTNAAAAAAWTSGGANQFGYALSVTNNGGSGSPAPAGSLSATNFAGFVTGAGETCGSATGRTGNALASDLDGCGTGLCGSAGHAWNFVL